MGSVRGEEESSLPPLTPPKKNIAMLSKKSYKNMQYIKNVIY